jgi:hypothetical protein
MICVKSFEIEFERQDKKLSSVVEQLESADKEITVDEARIADKQKNVPGGKAGISNIIRKVKLTPGIK